MELLNVGANTSKGPVEYLCNVFGEYQRESTGKKSQCWREPPEGTDEYRRESVRKNSWISARILPKELGSIEANLCDGIIYIDANLSEDSAEYRSKSLGRLPNIDENISKGTGQYQRESTGENCWRNCRISTWIYQGELLQFRRVCIGRKWWIFARIHANYQSGNSLILLEGMRMKWRSD